MDVKPQNFFIGVVDFFSVWLPGAILAWFLKITLFDPTPEMEKVLRIPNNENVKVIFFLLATYLIGSILFGFSSLLDILYDKKLKKIFKIKDKDNFELEVKTATGIGDTFINTDEWILKHHECGQLSNEQIKKLYSKGYRYIINTYNWSQHYLLYKNPEALADVKRLEADSKFFRSLVLTFLIISIILFINAKIVIAIVFLLLSIVSLYLFSKFRYKSTIRAYELVITHYYLHSPPTTIKDPVAVSSSVIKSDMKPSFMNKHRRILDWLLKGFSNQPKQVTINRGELQNTFFSPERNEWWYCMEGKGVITIKDQNREKLHFIQPNAILPISKEVNYSFINTQKEPLELLVIDR